MDTSEFDIIDQYFKASRSRKDVAVGVGDDCAVLDVPVGKQLAITTDTLISGVHFFEHNTAEDIACKAVTVNLSDLASMGAEPAWMSLALTLPEVDHQWLEEFSDSFFQSIDKFGIQLIGGDTTKGALSITIQAIGFVEPGRSMLRANANPGDLIYVSGTLGDAALGLALMRGKLSIVDENASYFINRLNRPAARLELGQAISEYSTCAIDISDGIFADLNHILDASLCGASIEIDKLPLSSHLREYLADKKHQKEIIQLMSGDDYELCFTVNEKHSPAIQAISEQYGIPLTSIGVINDGDSLDCIDGKGDKVDISKTGFNHFS